MMEVIQGVCIFCTENDSVLSNDNKSEFLKIIKINFFSNNRFNFSEFCKLFNKLSICLLCAYKVQCCSNLREIIKKGDTNKNKRNHNKCCSLCFKTDNVTNGTPQLKQEANQFTKDVKKNNNINIKHICLSCSFSVSVWSSILTAIWNLLNDESADSEKENVTKTNGKPMNENVDAENTENKTKTMRLRTRPCTENDNKSEDSAKINNKSDDGIGRNVGKRRGESTTQDEKNKIESTRKRSTDSQNDTTPKKRRISARVNSESKSSSEENLKRTSRKNERSSNSIEKSDIDSTPVQSKKSRNTEEISTPKILRSNFRLSLKTNTAKKGKQISSHSNGIDKKLKHLNTVNCETRKKNMYLSYNAVTDQRIMFEIPYILCTPYEKESFITKKTKGISSEVNQSFKETSLSSEKNMNTRKGLKNKGKYTTPLSGTTPRQTNKRQTRLKNANQKKEILIIEVSSTDDEASGDTTPSYRRSRRIRKPTSKALIESKMAKLSASTDKSTAKNKFKCTVCNQHFSTYYKMRLHKVKHDKSPSSTQTSQNSENMETSEDSDKNTEDNNTETDEESDNGEHVSSVDSEENNVESLDQHNTNIDSETNETDENTEDTNKINENTEGTKINGETSIIHEDIEKSDKKLDTDKNVSEEISEEQSIDKDVVSTTTDEHDIVEISGKQASERQSSNDDAINTANNVEEKNNDEINHENTNTDAANETDDNKLTGSDKSHNEQSDTEGTILNENSAEQITNDIIEGICEFTNMTKTQESKEMSVQDKAWEENANSIELTEENAELIQTNSIVQDTNNAVDELNKKQNDENQEDDSSNHEEKNKIQEEVLISTKEIISEISTTSSQDDETIQRNLNVIEIIDDESSQTTTTCSESAIDDINDLNPDILIITDKKNVSTNNISVEQSGLTEQNSEVESLKVSSQGSTVSNISPDNKTETTVTEECSQKSNGVISMANNSQQKEIIQDFAMMEDLLENMGA